MPATIGICGGGAWGTALTDVLRRKGLEVSLWSRTGSDPIALAASKDVVILAVPTSAMHEVAQNAAPHLAPGAMVVSTAKGFEPDTDRTMTAMLRELLPDTVVLAALSGPNLAVEITNGMPAATVVASTDAAVAERLRDTCSGDQLRCYSSEDVVGVEYAGALKNVIAIASGICDGIEVGDNGKAAIITRGLAEIARLGTKAGADPLTFAGLAGVGDCLATCMSPLSRNRSFGEAVARGEDPAGAEARLGTVEGIAATKAALRLARKYGVDVPIAEAVTDVIFRSKPIPEAIAGLMRRDPADELPK